MFRNSDGITQSSVTLAEVFTGADYDEDVRMDTKFGPKTVKGVADLIESTARTGDLLKALKDVLEIVEFELENDPEPEDLPSWKRAVANANSLLEDLSQ